jgi:hypothetical protein
MFSHSSHCTSLVLVNFKGSLPKWHAISLPSMPLALLSLLLETPPVDKTPETKHPTITLKSNFVSIFF